jgi:hypothetical protein
MIRETTEAKIEFHERYWSKVSNEGALMVDGVSCMSANIIPNSEIIY